ncbi:MAG: AMP-binding protein [Desulfarculaceae bacterium]|jgi:fatty-acyl-CoA synthase
MTEQTNPNWEGAYAEIEGLNFPQLLDLQAEQRPDKVWLVHGDKRYTFKQFSEMTDHLAVALLKAGFKPGEACGLLFPNSPEYLMFQFAILKMGGILIPLNTRYRSHELTFMLNFSDARYLFMVDRYLKADFTQVLAEIRSQIPQLSHIYVDGPKTPQDMLDIRGLYNFRATSEELAELRANPVPDTAPATMLFTSGTTSQPKGVIMSHRARVWCGLRISERMRVTDSDALLNPLPFCHEFGGFTITSHAVICGCKMAIMEVFNADEALRIIEREKVSVLYGVPTMFSYMLNSPLYKQTDLSTLRTGYMSGATCPLELVKQVQDDMGCNISVAYGLSEAPSHTISEYDDPPEVKASTVGKPIRDAEAKIVDDKRQEVPLGTPGEIVLKGQNVMTKYYKRPDATQSALDDGGWLFTDDLGIMDEKGYLTFVGRKTDMIVTGGFNVFPLEVEEVLYKLPYVAHAAVVGVPDPVKGERIVACIVLKSGHHPGPEEIVAFCREQLANYKIPGRVVFMDNLPVTTTNKIKKRELPAILEKMT